MIKCIFEKTKTMKLLSLLLFAPLFSYSQITVDVNDFADGGDTVRFSATNNPGIDYSTTGANVTWDFSDLNAESQELTNFKDPSTAGPLVSFTFGTFADPEYQATNYYKATDIPLDMAGQFLPITINEVNQFARHTNNSASLVGLAINVEGNDIPVPSDTIETKYVFPLNYGDSYSSRGYTNLDMNPIFNLIWIQYRQRSSTVDGWGTVTTPYGSFDALRVKHEITELDSVFIDLTGTPMWIELPVPLSVEYEWLSKNELAPILSIRISLAGGNETVTQIKYKDIYLGLDASITENTLQLNIGPNPVEDDLFINGLEGNAPYQIVTLEGKVIRSGIVQDENLVSNAGISRVDMRGLNTGIYLIHIGEGLQTFTQRIVKL